MRTANFFLTQCEMVRRWSRRLLSLMNARDVLSQQRESRAFADRSLGVKKTPKMGSA
jgi:hypothetical protein